MTAATNNTQAANATVVQERSMVGRAWDAIPTAVKWTAGAAIVGGVGYLAYRHFTKGGDVDTVATAVNALAGTAPALLEGAEALPAVSAAAAEALTAFA